ncbi:tetratricopeptide repeat protein [Ruegeria sp. MALMAid1280]|uniref:tetratricopeptide repeat protein n=1 Tax=Ruegeria sp. MALMAid1280 TaxID=3411634 RepID=UPI003BA0BEF9
MKLRLAALIIVIATAIWSLNPMPDYAEMSATCMGNKGSMAGVVATCSALMKIDDLTPAQQSRLISARGWAFYSGKRYDEAIADYTAASALQPLDATPVLRRALALEAVEDVAGSDAAYSKAVALNPSSAPSRYHKARFDQRQGNFADAIEGYEKTLEIDPAYNEAGWDLANTYFEVDGLGATEKFLTQAEKRWPDQMWVHLGRLLLHLNGTGDAEKGLAAANGVSRLESNGVTNLFFPAMVHLKIGDEEKGVEFVEDYARWTAQRSYDRKGIVERWGQRVDEWLGLRGNQEWITRAQTYAELGRTDLAQHEINIFLKDARRFDREYFFCLIRETGVSVSPEAEAGSANHLSQTITDYVQQLAASGGYADFGVQ